MKTIGLLHKLRHRGGERVNWVATFTVTPYNMVRRPSARRGVGLNHHETGGRAAADVLRRSRRGDTADNRTTVKALIS